MAVKGRGYSRTYDCLVLTLNFGNMRNLFKQVSFKLPELKGLRPAIPDIVCRTVIILW